MPCKCYRCYYARFPQAHVALDETIAFSRAVHVADTVTNPKSTLIVVTSDHSHTMTINGYPSRDDEIVGPHVGRDGDAYSILSYANGPSANVHTYEKQSSAYGKWKPRVPDLPTAIYVSTCIIIGIGIFRFL